MEVPHYHRGFFNSDETLCKIGDGEIGGKASGLFSFQELLKNHLNKSKYTSINIKIPKFVVIATDHFDGFMKMNNLYEAALSDLSDKRKAKLFQDSQLPPEIVGDLRTIITNTSTPLAIRSSSLLEDSLNEPFAGVYATKMIANHEASQDKRFQKFVEAIKFVYSSTFFKSALQYFEATKNDPRKEKMAIIIQEVIGTKRNKRFYPSISGVARSHNYYPFGRSKSEDGVVNLALGLGKTIVDGGISWMYNPKYPKISAPFASPKELMKNTQNKFLAVNINPIINYDPLVESEYLIELDLSDSDFDHSNEYSASTFDFHSNKIIMGTGSEGARVLDFGRLLKLDEFKYNLLINDLLQTCSNYFQSPVEIEFAFDIDKRTKKNEFALLQVRAMFVSNEIIEIEENEFNSPKAIIRTKQALGNDKISEIKDVVYVDPKKFESKFTKQIASEVEGFNREFVKIGLKYLLIGFGRWGSSDEWLGIPVDWSQVSNAKVIVESSLPNFNVDFSQGSHFFHNIAAFKVLYFSVKNSGSNMINWDWLLRQNLSSQKQFVKHISLTDPLKIKVDGRTGNGIISYE
ncbi:MAG: PEP/pyruvate-binding domain-containing protein [Melioribacteraceae bacterium]|nr:PEP/pyruvate-binding domain-containing protein [Melioribacteraceae bacterium]MCF8265011.1 PEP/pyruvate-binding domain-containing protein [Melioribacteraceae bacterium]